MNYETATCLIVSLSYILAQDGASEAEERKESVNREGENWVHWVVHSEIAF